MNTGHNSTGHRSTGHRSTGHKSTGNNSTGHNSTGNNSTGNHSTGHRSTGYWSTGNDSTGNHSTGHDSTGHRSTGHRSTGNHSTGNNSTGHRSTGNHSTGNNSTGNWSISNFSTGHFSTKDYAGFGAFNKFCSPDEWENAEKPDFLYFDFSLWVDEVSMTEKEKADNPSFSTVGGYLKVLDYKEAFQASYKKASPEEIDLLKALPNFDHYVFFEISGIDLNSDLERQNKKEALIAKANELMAQAEAM